MSEGWEESVSGKTQNSVRKVHDDTSQIRKVLPEDGRREVLEQGTLALVFNTTGMEWVPVLYLRRESCGHHKTHSKTKTNPANRSPGGHHGCDRERSGWLRQGSREWGQLMLLLYSLGTADLQLFLMTCFIMMASSREILRMSYYSWVWYL